MYNILFYEDEKGNKPVESFIDMLDAAALTNKGARIQLEQIIYCLNRLEDRGTRAGEKFTKRISGDIWELRPGNNRILFFGWNGNYFVLLHHFAKTTQKTPPREIEIASKRMDNWLSRKGRSE
ncbi:type II toxin-antitoxin system RelE/ParE family toxin [Paenibacillus motobuensis]|uniref:type II toxin-antitoxin system RelE/ParE family toxin n=1 Tax=Paenibacillus TaxID=44249 RepID=UPI0020411758|nr:MULTISPECIES: type II toxin-antitoxin system RelE/ParE family toxin [Paenibacillus]MCM3041518.1 type II toxin-antitoxin system RelE/ParE family toxin [Paenibacillus lutimineralis]MCM3648622.1 type II toxin-antitoxin system RelE/ParE family toxin [Paenibacillus motobuensis]